MRKNYRAGEWWCAGEGSEERQRDSTAAVIYAAIMSGGAGSQGSMMGKTER